VQSASCTGLSQRSSKTRVAAKTCGYSLSLRGRPCRCADGFPRAGGSVAALAALPSAAQSAISAELARKCRELAIKAHPTLPAGSKGGAEQAQRDYFRECIAKNGDMNSDARK